MQGLCLMAHITYLLVGGFGGELLLKSMTMFSSHELLPAHPAILHLQE